MKGFVVIAAIALAAFLFAGVEEVRARTFYDLGQCGREERCCESRYRGEREYYRYNDRGWGRCDRFDRRYRAYRYNRRDGIPRYYKGGARYDGNRVHPRYGRGFRYYRYNPSRMYYERRRGRSCR